MQDIINGKIKPTLWSPSSPIWIDRLSSYSSQSLGSKWIDPDDANSCKVFLKSPLVILTTTDKRDYISKLFTSANPWSTLEYIGRSGKSVPWGKLHYSHANPLVANSGMLTLGLMLNEYDQLHGGSSTLDQVAGSTGFIGFMSDVDKTLDYDEAAQKGSQPLVDAFVDSTASRDFITAYESSALSACDKNSSLAVVYPKPTIVADQMVGVLSAPWVTDAQKQAAAEFMTFLGSSDSMKDAVSHFSRPASTQSDISLDSALQAHQAQGFQTTYSAIEIPPYDALNDSAFQWNKHVAPQHQDQ
jgi:hypothetical protein